MNNLVFNSQNELREAERAHKERVRKYWEGERPSFNSDFCRKLTDFMEVEE